MVYTVCLTTAPAWTLYSQTSQGSTICQSNEITQIAKLANANLFNWYTDFVKGSNHVKPGKM